ncbi:MAG: mechanosensitive ion channel [Trueperaceae bacterium]|nr:MAG: mechanosensitive ion channel [Trueperaceae bacterium]
MQTFISWLTLRGLGEWLSFVIAVTVGLVAVLLLCLVAYYATRRVILRLLRVAARRSRTTWDDALVDAKVFSRLSHLVPAVILHALAPLVFRDFPQIVSTIRTGAFVYMALMGMTVVDALLNAMLMIYSKFRIASKVQIKPIVQVFKIVVYCSVGVSVVAILLGSSPLVFFSGLGAFTAVLLLIFRDPILGLVAGIQLMSNQMVRVGDWIELPKHHADGDVIDVSLTTVKIQNWDKTISTVPTYTLVSESFRNWRGMSESGGRRIKRAVHIDVTSIAFCDEEMLERFLRIQFITEYVERKLAELEQYNRERKVDTSLLVNGRHLTNIGTFRAYLVAYLRNHPLIRQDMTSLVRQLPVTENGLPIEIYVFSSDQVWANYEAIQADIFDHVLAVLPLFDLRAFQNPTGADLRALAQTVAR